MNLPSFRSFLRSVCAAVALAVATQAGAYDIPAFHKAPFDRDGIFLEESERQSLLEALAAISSNFGGISTIDEDVVEKSLGLALAIDPFHGNSRKAHEALSAGEKPNPTNFYDSRSAAAEALWGIASELASPPVEPEAGRLAPLVMEIALLVHPSTDADRILEFASLSEGIDEAWAGFVDLQPAINNSNLRARSFRREARDLQKNDATAPAAPEKPMVEAPTKPAEVPRMEKGKERLALTMEEIPPVEEAERTLVGIFPAGEENAAGTFQLKIRAASGSTELQRFPFLLERTVEDYPFIPVISPESSSMRIGRSPVAAEKARELGIIWQQGAVGETDFFPSGESTQGPEEAIRVTLPLILCLQSISQSKPLNPNIGIIGAFDRSEGVLQRVQQPAEVIESADLLEIPYLLVPEPAFPSVVDSITRSEELELLFYSELLSFDSLENAFDLVTMTELPEALTKASEIFAEIKMVSTRMSLPELARNEKVQERLEEIITLVPNHFSAKAMLEFGLTPIDEDALLRDAIREIDAVIEPFFVLRRELRADTQDLYGKIEEADETLFRLRATLLPEARDYHDLATDMLEAAEAFLSLSNKETSIAQQRIEEVQRLLEELIAIKEGLGMPTKTKSKSKGKGRLFPF